jgi:hypothetical protein
MVCRLSAGGRRIGTLGPRKMGWGLELLLASATVPISAKGTHPFATGDRGFRIPPAGVWREADSSARCEDAFVIVGMER